MEILPSPKTSEDLPSLTALPASEGEERAMVAAIATKEWGSEARGVGSE